MSGLFKTPKAEATAPPAPPPVDNSRVAVAEARRIARRGGRKSTILNGRPVAGGPAGDPVGVGTGTPGTTNPRGGGRRSTLLN